MEAAAIQLDADQQRAASCLADLLDRHHRPLKNHRGIYLHGRPGRGKTMVMDRFFASVDPKHKRRFHFHTFFTGLHAQTHVHGSIDKAIDTLLGKARLVCFDEFHVHDIGDAMLITRMLDALFARRLTLVVTSNYAPAELLPNPLFHDLFVPTIERIVAELDVVSLDGPLDYRTIAHGRAAGFRAGRYIVGPAPAFGRTGRQESAVSDDDSPGSPGPRVGVAVGSRTVRALAVDDATITLDFTDLCATPTSAADYIDLAERFPTWTLCGVPLLREVPPDWAMRLVNLVDVLYDADRTLTVYAQAPVQELVAGVRDVPDIARAASRLGELSQTEAVAVS
ncbi:cell division protein ZapE [Nocardia cyriacigeorgica]|jgi:cell division protein ZapE|uniref:cell division protein ZapE n=1 Tax=Nocardia cyriacigeorgica TaxID=135487 RepID=UPI00030F272C|nr:cell division protein ZapE [Nocardia cyriacigeorgica]AVH21101.1 cell division protein ZapE [Nocardia cyriacigeorgica]PPJ07526.1 cell division protein ZapE [Nocardia cyriacigeorgica]TLF58386.1 cell division protein ZapE [Nocardia cyriacigeorgica]